MSAAQNQYETGLDKTPANYVPLTPLSFLARSAAVAQVVMLRQMINKGVGASRAWLDRDDFERLKSLKRTLDQVRLYGIQRKKFGL